MARQVTLNGSLSNQMLPNGQRYDGGAVVILSDQEYSELSAAWKSANLASDTSVGGGGGGISPPAGDIGGSAGTPTVVATHLASALPVAQGGTGAATQQAALNAIAGAHTNHQVLAGDGTNVTLRAVASADLAGAITAFKGSAASITPSATLNTLGTPVTMNNDSGYTGFIPLLMNVVTTGLGSETVTLQSVVTFSDNSTNTQAALTTFTTNATSAASLTIIIAMIGAVDGKSIKSIAFSVKSSINSSAASLTVNLVGVNLP